MTTATGRRVFGGLYNCDGSASPGETARTSGAIAYEVQDDDNRKVASNGDVDISPSIPES